MSNKQESTRRMGTPSGKMADVPYSRIEEAIKDGLEFTKHMVSPDGKQEWVPISKLAVAEQKGWKNSGIPMPLSPYEEKQAEEQRKVDNKLQSFGEKTIDYIKEHSGDIVGGITLALTAGTALATGGAGPVIARGANAAARSAAPYVSNAGRLLGKAKDAIGNTLWAGTKNAATGASMAGGAAVGTAGAVVVDDLTGSNVKNAIKGLIK